METVPSSAVCTFVGEGAANVVFELSGVEDHPDLNGQLLRLPKDELTGPKYAELQDYWENKVSPLFKPDELVQQRLVQLPQDPEFGDRLNQQLDQIEREGTRRHDFKGHRFVPGAMSTGMLVEDMRPKKTAASRPSSSRAKGKGAAGGDAGQEEDENDRFTLHEIKPKWLHQSPRAPPGAEQCRNCAREVQRNLKNKTRNPVFCPLNLVKATDFPRNQEVVGDIRRHLGLSAAQSDNLQAWLKGSSLLRRLRAKQWELDHANETVVPAEGAPAPSSAAAPDADEMEVDAEGASAPSSAVASLSSSVVAQAGSRQPSSAGADDNADDNIANADDNIAKYCLAMTLRDCSLFLRIPRLPGAKADDVVAKLADLDRKNYDSKHEYWERMENGLHEKNLYWRSGSGGVSGALTECQLPFYKTNVKKLEADVKEYYRLE